MCASDRRLRAIAVAMLLGAGLMPAVAQNTSREAEQLRRLRLQLQQLQQQASTQQQAAQQAAAAQMALQRQLDGSEAALKAERAKAATQARAAEAQQQALDGLSQQQAQQRSRADELQAALEAERRQAAELRAALAQTQQRRGNLENSYATLSARHRLQGDGLQTCAAHNERLRALGLELLQRYEHKGLAEVLAADEPFLQRGRTTLENLVQGYRDKLDAEAFTAPR